MARNWGPPGNDMVIKSPPTYNELAVSQRGAGANLSVDVASGQAWVDGYFLQSTAVVNVPIAANSSGNPRIDTIVVNIDMVTKLGTITVVQGTPAGTPVAPALTQTQGVTWQMALANVAVANGAASIVNANITDGRVYSNELRNYTKRINDSIATSVGATPTADLSGYPVFSWLLGTNATFAFSNPPPAGVEGTYTFYLKQGGGGSILVTWPAAVKWPGGVAPTLTTTVGRTDVIVVTTRDGGVTYLGAAAVLNVNI